MPTRYFEMPQDPEAMASFIEQLPKNEFPEIHDGKLWATSACGLTRDDVAFNTGFHFDQFRGCCVSGNLDDPPDLSALIAENKRPHFVQWRDIPWSEKAAALAGGLLRKGYQGNMDFHATSYYWDKTHYLLGCSLKLGPWVVKKESWFASLEEEGLGEHPPRVKIWYDPREDANESHVAGGIELCQKMGFQEYTPKRKAA